MLQNHVAKFGPIRVVAQTCPPPCSERNTQIFSQQSRAAHRRAPFITNRKTSFLCGERVKLCLDLRFRLFLLSDTTVLCGERSQQRRCFFRSCI